MNIRKRLTVAGGVSRCSLFTPAAVAVAVVAMMVAVAPALAAGDGNQAVCPNEALAGFQSYLADCRAYEQVTPPFKGGLRFLPTAVSSDGSRLLGQALGTFAGAQSNIFGALYMLSRSGSGWAASSIGPPASLFPADQFFGASAGLESTLWAMHRASQSMYAVDLYVRKADGSFVMVGPMVPPSAAAGPPAGLSPLMDVTYTYVGASDDLSHVLFRVPNNPLDPSAPGVLWPGDTTSRQGVGRYGGDSLYEYVGTGNRQPELVGVSDGHTVVKGEALVQGRLISDCSTFPGSEGGEDAYNAVSSDGETVFFTAEGGCGNPHAPEVGELYARIGGIETVAVSEPLPTQCQACNTPATVALGRRDAEFRGASRDGSKVFFLTVQELLTGDTGMNLYEYDFGNPVGKKVVRVSMGSPNPEVLGVARVSQDGSHVYFVAKGVLTEGPNGEGREPVAGGDNLYVFERNEAYPAGRVAFVATLSEEDAEAVWSGEDVHRVQATPDGRFLVFESAADLTPGDTSSVPQVFEYDALREELVRVSVGQAGYPAGNASADANASSIERLFYSKLQQPMQADSNLAVSRDGRTVVFFSGGALTAGAQTAAAAGATSVYEYRSTASLAAGNVYLVSDGTDTMGRSEGFLDASGADVFFATADPLLASDVDTQDDFYDARADGGFPVADVPAACVGEACQGAAGAQSSFGVPGSTTAPAGGNAPSSPSGVVVAPKARPPARARLLARALRACRREPRRRRVACEARARKRYRAGSAVNAKGKG